MRQEARLCGMLMMLAVIASACGPTAAQRAHEGTEDEIVGPRIADDWDASEARWRKDIASERWSNDDMNLLTDDPPAKPDDYGKVAKADSAETASDGDAFFGDEPQGPPPSGFWGHVKAGANSFGKASFAVLTVAVTVGMAVAPYLLL